MAVICFIRFNVTNVFRRMPMIIDKSTSVKSVLVKKGLFGALATLLFSFGGFTSAVADDAAYNAVEQVKIDNDGGEVEIETIDGEKDNYSSNRYDNSSYDQENEEESEND